MRIQNLTRQAELPTGEVPLTIKRLEYDFRTDHWHRHLDFSELVVVISGSGYQETSDSKKLLKAGCLLYMPPGSVHRYSNINNFVHYNILFASELLNFPRNNPISLPGYNLLINHSDSNRNPAWLKAGDLARLIGILETCRQELISAKPGWQEAAHLEFLRAMLFIFRNAIAEDPQSGENIFQIGNTLRIMKINYRKNFSLRELAGMAGMSESRFRHRFLEIVGRSPIDYLIRLRLSCAVNLLTTSASLDSIAAESGFSERNYMSRQFHRHIGISPSEFRRKYAINNTVLNQVMEILENFCPSQNSSFPLCPLYPNHQ